MPRKKLSLSPRRKQFSRLIFLIQERLYCTEKEAKILVSLLLCIILGNFFQIWRHNRSRFDDAYYAESDSLFQLLSHRADSLDAVDTLHVGFGSDLSDLSDQDTETQMWVFVDTLAKPQASFPININGADARLLQALPRIGPSMADRIIQFRSTNGPFSDVNDLINVKGIGARTLEQLLPLITLTDPDSLGARVDTIDTSMGDARLIRPAEGYTTGQTLHHRIDPGLD